MGDRALDGGALSEWLNAVLSLREAGASADMIARSLGRERAWVEALLATARDPVARALVTGGRLSSVEAWQRFMALPPSGRRRLLDSDEPISSARCDRAARGCGNGQGPELPG